MENFLQVKELSKLYGDKTLFSKISFVVNSNSKMAIIARNGAGKSTLLNILTNKDYADEGEIIKKRGLTISFLSQNPVLNEAQTIIDEVLASDDRISKLVKEYELAVESDDKKRLSKCIEQMDTLSAWNFEVKVKKILSVLRIDKINQPIHELSGGQKKRVALAKTMIQEPDLYILDEPTNHLDLEMVEWLEEYLRLSKSAILMVTHDRFFLDNVCNTIIELDDHQLYQYDGNYSYYLQKREERIVNRGEEISRARNLFRKELDWMRRMPKARGTKAKYRVDQFKELKEKSGKQIMEGKVNLQVQASRLGKKILEIKHLQKSFGEIKILNDFSYSFKRYEKIGIVGKNGTGKTTFLNLITRNLSPDSGKIDTGETIKYGYYKQDGLEFNQDKKVIDIVREIAETVKISDKTTLSVEQFLNYFMFPYKMHNALVRKLSGGEQRRLYLATVLMQTPNFLILDEPTNDLDILTLNILEEYLTNFGGCVIVVSHDRYFMDKMVDQIFSFEGNGQVNVFSGNYTQYRQNQQEQENREKKEIKAEKDKRSAKNKNVTKKLTYKEKLEFEKLGKEIEELENEKAAVEQLMNSGSLSGDDLVEKSERIGEIIRLLDDKSDRWLELSERIG